MNSLDDEIHRKTTFLLD